MDIVQEYISTIGWESIILTSLKLLFIFALAWGLMLVIRHFLVRMEKRLLRDSQQEGEPPNESVKRVETLIRLIRQGVYILLWLTVGLIVLREVGIDVTPILASAGILGLAVGFGAQNLVRDVISGFFIILENQVRINDVAIINGTGGLVERINFRTVVLRDLGGIVHVFPNGAITSISNMTREWSAYVFDIGVAYKENTDEVTAIMKDVGTALKADEYFGTLMLAEPEIFGVDKFDTSAVILKGRIKTRPIRQWEVGREYLRRIKQAFDENGIEIPFPHQTVYFGEKSKPFELQILEKLKTE